MSALSGEQAAACHVACIYSILLTVFVKHIPMLAPLLDRMTTRDIKHRFTADQALRFFEDSYSDLTEFQLSVEQYQGPDVLYDEYDRWQDLSEEFKRKWAVYREPPTPLITKLLRAFFDNERIPFYFRHSFRCLFRFFSAPRSIWIRITARNQ